MSFLKYMHIEKFGNDEVQGIEFGDCYIFPKLDGTNASVWMEDGVLCGGSRNRQLSLEQDNAGFYSWLINQQNIYDFVKETGFRLYGEWLVPHSLKIYRKDAWNKFYVFDVYDDVSDRFIDYASYKSILDKFSIDYIPCTFSIKNAQYESLLKLLKENTFLIEEDSGVGEGIVIKNYSFQNRFGRVCWAKLITNSFKETHCKEMGACRKNEKDMLEQQIVNKYVDSHLVEKTYAKIVNENQGWNSKYISRLLSTVFYDLVKECSWDFVKKHKMPTINFKTLNYLTINRIKELKSEIF